MSTTETNKKVVTELIDGLFTRGDLAAADQYLSEDYLDHDPPFDSDGTREGMRGVAAIMRRAFPDWRSEVHCLIAEDDMVAEHFTATGTHRGELLGMLPTGRTASLRGVNIFRLRDGLVVERWGVLDVAGFQADLGA